MEGADGGRGRRGPTDKSLQGSQRAGRLRLGLRTGPTGSMMGCGGTHFSLQADDLLGDLRSDSIPNADTNDDRRLNGLTNTPSERGASRRRRPTEGGRRKGADGGVRRRRPTEGGRRKGADGRGPTEGGPTEGGRRRGPTEEPDGLRADARLCGRKSRTGAQGAAPSAARALVAAPATHALA
jgi:hypothetical protein